MSTINSIDSDVWFQHAWRNRIQSLLLLIIMAGFLVILGTLLWGLNGILILLAIGLVGVLFNPSFSPWFVMRMYKANPIDPQQLPVLWSYVSQLAKNAGLKSQPDLYYVPSSMLNAFAVGSRQQAAIGITDGLLRQLNMRELVAVLAHEISHIRSNDLWVMGLADMFSRGTSLLSLMGQILLLLNLPLLMLAELTINWFAILLLIFAPTLSALAQLALSRTREFDADLNAVRLTGDPEGLAIALSKIEKIQGGWLERIFLPGRRIPEPSLLRTHPRTEERITRLMALKPDRIHASMYPAIKDIESRLGHPITRIPAWHINGLWH